MTKFTERTAEAALVTLTVEPAPHPLREAFDAGLPVAGCWNTGENQQTEGQDAGYSPDWQYDRIVNYGDPILPTFEWFDDFAPNAVASRPVYYQPLFDYAAEHSLPLVFVGRNFIDLFRLNPPWQGDTPVDHPFHIKASDGSVVKRASPWSPNVHQWYALGQKVGSYLATEFAAHYPVPPAVYLMDNNETGYDEMGESLQDTRVPTVVTNAYANLPQHEASQVHRAEYFRAMSLRYAEFRRGLRDALPEGWKRIKMLAYGQFGNEFGAAHYEPDKLRYSFPWGDAGGGGAIHNHDGMSCNVGYLHNWSSGLPGLVRSPQMEAGNVLHALQQYRGTCNPDFLLESLFWNGKNVSKDVWQGVIRCVLWQTRTQLNRLFVGSSQTVAATFDRDMDPLLRAVNEVHENPVLRRFWEKGRLLPNRWTRDFVAQPKANQYDTATGFGHPYWWNVPVEFTDTDRLYLQHIPQNNRLVPWNTLPGEPGPDARLFDRWGSDRSHNAEIPVFAIALQDGEDYLLYVHAPNGALEDVEVQICPIGNTPAAAATVDVPVPGAFYHLSGNSIEVV